MPDRSRPRRICLLTQESFCLYSPENQGRYDSRFSKFKEGGIMRKPARNLLYVVLGVVCAALLVQGVGLKLPGIMKALTAVSGATVSSPSSVESQAASAGAAVSSALVSEKACTGSSSIESSFNATPIAGGNFIWFNSAIHVDGPGSDAATLFLNDSAITFAANGRNYNLSVPAARITFDPAATAASTSFDAASNRWATIVPGGLSGKVFLSGLAFPVPAGGLPGGISSVTWSAAISTDKPGVTAQWGWGAAVYTTIATDYNALAVNPVGEGRPSHGAMLLSKGENSENVSVGKPASLEAFVTGGAGGDGGSNFTGSYGTVGSVTPCAAGASAQPRTNSRTTITVGNRGGAGTNGPLVTTGLAITKTCPPQEPPSTLFQCTYTIQNQDPDNTVINLAVTNEVPFPGGSPVAVPCLVAGSPVTTLQPLGVAGDTCGGTIDETSPPCDPAGSVLFMDQVAATGTDTNSGGTPLPVTGSTTNVV